jgi:hypothetical protein
MTGVAATYDVQDRVVQAITTYNAGDVENKLKTIKRLPFHYLDKKVSELLVLEPFALVFFPGQVAVEGERMQTAGSTIRQIKFMLFIGSRKVTAHPYEDAEQVALGHCDGIRELLDGHELSDPKSQDSFTIYWKSDAIAYGDTDGVVYGQEYEICKM